MAKITKHEVKPVRPPPPTWTLELSDAEARALRAYIGKGTINSSGVSAVYATLTHDTGFGMCDYPPGDSRGG